MRSQENNEFSMEVDENLKTFWNHMPPESMCNGDSYVYVGTRKQTIPLEGAK